MKIYIASSYRNLHAVQLLRDALTAEGHTILDWTVFVPPLSTYFQSERKAALDDPGRNEVFDFCTEACGRADAVLYIGPAGQDSACEVGIAYAAGVPVFGIAGPLEEPGLILRKCVRCWFQTAGDFLDYFDKEGGPCGYWGEV